MKTKTKLLLSSAVIVAGIFSMSTDAWAGKSREQRLEKERDEKSKQIKTLKKENRKLNNEAKEIKKHPHKNLEKPSSGQVSQGVPVNRSDYYLDKYREYLQDTSRRDRD